MARDFALGSAALKLAVFLAIASTAFGQTTLSPGDVAVVAYKDNGTPDAWAAMFLVDIASGTEFWVTDSGVQVDASNNPTGWRFTENLVHFVASRAYSAGSIVYSNATDFTGSLPCSGASGYTAPLSFSQSGDSITIFQRTTLACPMTTVTDASYIFLFNAITAFASSTSTSTTGVPAVLRTAKAFVGPVGSGTGGLVTRYAGPLSGSKADLLPFITSVGNWTIQPATDSLYIFPTTSPALSRATQTPNPEPAGVTETPLPAGNPTATPGPVTGILCISCPDFVVAAAPAGSTIASVPFSVSSTSPITSLSIASVSPSAFSSAISLSGATSAAAGATLQAAIRIDTAAVFTAVSALATKTLVTTVTVSFSDGSSKVFRLYIATHGIYAIQGSGWTSPLVGTFSGSSVTGSFVGTAGGVVTGFSASGFYIQDPVGDGNTATSDGMYVFTGTTNIASAPLSTLALGQYVFVQAAVVEYVPTSYTGDLSLTELSATAATAVYAPATITPVPTVSPITINVTATELVYPDGISFWERLENMLVYVDQPISTGPTIESFSYFYVVAKPNQVLGSGFQPSSGVIVLRNIGGDNVDYNPERIQVDDEARVSINGARYSASGSVSTLRVRTGDRFTYLQGVLDYSFNSYRLQPNMDAESVWTPAPLPAIGNSISYTRGTTDLSLAIMNMHDFMNAVAENTANSPVLTATQIANKAAKALLVIKNELKCPDIILLQEIEQQGVINGDSNGYVAGTTVQALGPRLAAAGCPYIAVARPVSDVRGITCGIMYRTDRGITYHGHFLSTEGSSTLPAKADTNQCFSGNSAAGFSAGRQPLVGNFTFQGKNLVLISNHFKSKGGDDPVYQSTWPPVRASEVQKKCQAQYLREYLDTVLSKTPYVCTGGDWNDFPFPEPGEGSDTIAIVKGSGSTALTDLADLVPESSRFSYNYDGNAQVLDQILVSSAFLGRLQFNDYAHINSFYGPIQYETSTDIPFGSSDHDPQLAVFAMSDVVPTRTPAPSAGCPISDCNLVAGDIAVVGISAGTVDSFVLVALVDISAGTTIYVSDAAFDASDKLTSGGVVKYTTMSTLAAGTVFDSTLFTALCSGFVAPLALDVPDQLTVFQASSSAFNCTTGAFPSTASYIYTLYFGVNPTPKRPSSLIAPNAVNVIIPLAGNTAAYYAGSKIGTKATILAALSGGGGGRRRLLQTGSSWNSVSGNTGVFASTVGPFTIGGSTGGAFGEPHVRTLDGLLITYAGDGDVTMLESTATGLTMQARFYTHLSSVVASWTVATALKCNHAAGAVEMYAVDQGEYDARLIVDGSELAWLDIDGLFSNDHVSIQRAVRGYTITCLDGSMVLEVAMRRAKSAEDKEYGWMDVAAHVPSRMFGQVQGLMGSYDGDHSNDVANRHTGTVVSLSANELEERYLRAGFVDGIHEVEESWRVGAQHSLFTVEAPLALVASGTKRALLSSPDHPTANPQLILDAEALCEAHGITGSFKRACAFDVLTTGNERLIGHHVEMAGIFQ